jgi:hypothetical protein
MRPIVYQARNITSIMLSVIYHTISNRESENIIFRQLIQRNLDNLLAIVGQIKNEEEDHALHFMLLNPR